MRTSLAVVLAAGEGKRMKSRLPKVLHPIGRPADARARPEALRRGEGRPHRRRRRAGARSDVAKAVEANAPAHRSPSSGSSAARPTRVRPRERSKRAPTTSSSCSATRPSCRRSDRAPAPNACGGGGSRRRRHAAGRPDRLRPADHGGTAARRHPRGARRERGGARDRLLQRRRHGACRRDRARHPRRDRRTATTRANST